MFRIRCLLCAVFVFFVLLGAVPPAHAATFTVTKVADTADGTCNSDCSLREAVGAANDNPGDDAITFNATVFAAPRKSIKASWSINITQNVTITGPTAGVIVQSESNYNIFTVTSDGISAGFVGLTLSNGNTGVENNGTVTLTNCTLNGNTYGLINHGSAATLTNCTVSGNGNDGITNGTSSGGSGGSGDSGSRLNSGLSSSAVTSTATLTNCTLSGNGTGINNFTGNSVNVKNSIVAGNSTDTDGDPVTDGGNNIIGGTAAAAGLDPAGLLDNGGPSSTIALVSGSPAINAADDAGAPAKDQRGITRPQGAHSDIGAFEAKLGIVIRDAAAIEGNSGTTNIVFTVKLLLPATTDVTVSYATADGTASAGTDYIAKSGTLTIPAGALTGTVTVSVKGDTTIEPDETFTVNLSNPVNAPIADGQAVGTITADDFETPSLVVNTTSDVESRTDGLTSLRDAIAYANSHPGDDAITFNPTVFAAPRKTILVGSVFTLNENVTITGPTAGVTLEGVTVGGGNPPNSIFYVRLGSAAFDGLTISKGIYGILNSGGTTTITNCTVSDNSDTGFYNNSGGATLTNCTLSGNNFGFIGSYGAATLTNCTLSGNSYFGLSNTSGTATLTYCTVSGNTGGIKNDFIGGKINLNNSIVAGNTTNTDGPITYGLNNIAAGTAAAAGLETDGTGQPVLKDNDGPTKTIALIPGGSAIDAANDAAAPATDQRGFTRPQGAHSDIGAFELAPMVLVISDVAAKEGNSGTTNMVFTVKLMRASVNVVTVSYATADGTASAGTDYTAKSGTLTIPAGAFSATVTVPVKGDTTIEPDETFTVNLSNSVNAPIADAQAVGTISTDDFETPSLVVNTTGDAVNNTDGVNSLREAIAYANSNPDQSAITFNIPVDQQTNGVWDINTNSVLIINQSTTITGPGANLLRIQENDSNKSFAIFELNNNSSLSGLTLTNGSYGLVNLGTSQLTLTNCIVSGNSTDLLNQGTATFTGCTVSSSGVGLVNQGTATLTNCTLNDNSSPALVNNSGATATLTACTMSNNAYGINNDGTATVTNCTISGSTSNGINSSGTSTVANCTISGSSNIGFINISGTASTLTNCTLSGNNIGLLGNAGSVTATNCTITGSAGTGFLNFSPATLNNSLVVGNATNLGGGTAPGGSNNITTGTAADAGLDPNGLQDNGGPTKTIALLTGSAAIDAANDANAPAKDQRGVARPQGTHSDIGAYEKSIVSATPSLVIGNVTVTEGPAQGAPAGIVNANFPVTLSGAAAQTVTVHYATATPGSVPATAGTDYTATSGTLTFAPGETTKNVTVQVKGDTLDEVDERFAVNLSAATNATIADNQAFGTILDDDAAPSLAVNNVIVTEGNSGTTPATFTVTLSAPSGKTVTVQYSTNTPGSIPATAGSDYTALATTTLTFAPGQTSKQVTVLVNGDLLDEDAERFSLNLKNAGNASIADKEGFCTINDDDAAPNLRINDVSQAEGPTQGVPGGTTAFTFTVTLSAASGKTVKVNYQTTSPSSLIATPGTDYTAVPLTSLTFAPGQTSKTLTVLVNGDTTVEGTERFVVKLSTSVNATIADSEGFGTILNDDTAAPLLFEDDAPSE